MNHLANCYLENLRIITGRREKVTSPVYSKVYDTNSFVTGSVSLAMQRIFGTPDICPLDLADGLKQLLQEKHCDLNLLLQSDAATHPYIINRACLNGEKRI